MTRDLHRECDAAKHDKVRNSAFSTALDSPEKIGLPNIMFLHAAMSFALLVFVILCIPETKGRTLEEISKELAKK